LIKEKSLKPHLFLKIGCDERRETCRSPLPDVAPPPHQRVPPGWWAADAPLDAIALRADGQQRPDLVLEARNAAPDLFMARMRSPTAGTTEDSRSFVICEIGTYRASNGL
jgi:hypothetical protein